MRSIFFALHLGGKKENHRANLNQSVNIIKISVGYIHPYKAGRIQNIPGRSENIAERFENIGQRSQIRDQRSQIIVR
ncbi:MAG: hypothetical protein CVU09_17005 [Bacteroidetes bacterium HGW-Bacteroidetes-4]|jgi:hypothetical protein|nr:MAG: hypothetical protein CVU09_17005 [Bacteroidetes bacterium HGW-Bacteroidetes-4]